MTCQDLKATRGGVEASEPGHATCCAASDDVEARLLREADEGSDAREARIKGLCSIGDFAAAMTCLLQVYGNELRGFLRTRLGNEADTCDVFGSLCEDLWRGLPAFAWRCPVRAWSYTLARHAHQRFVSGAQRRRDRNLPLPDDVLEPAADVRTTTAAHKRTDTKRAFRALRDQLSDEDQLILVLRVDRGFGWTEIALITAADLDGDVRAGELSREAARVRKRFQLIKQRLRQLATDQGLLAPPLPWREREAGPSRS